MKDLLIAVRGAGEMATGIAHRLFVSGFRRIVMSEIAVPVSVRRKVAFSEAVYEKAAIVEGVRAELIGDVSCLLTLWDRGAIGVVIDREGIFLRSLRPQVLVDAIMAKQWKEPMKGMAPLVIGVGPGFRAPDEVDAVVESNRGHDLGRVIYDGEAEPYTGLPGSTAGYTKERVLRSPHAGLVRTVKCIGDQVCAGDVILYVDETPVRAEISGVLRGLIRPVEVTDEEKLGDIDPRGTRDYCFTISEKARAIGGGVLEAIMHRFHEAGLRQGANER